MNRLASRLLIGLALGVAVFVGISLWADLHALTAHLERFEWWLIAPVLLLSLTNYGLRFCKWHFLLGRAGVRVATGHSLLVFLSGISMAISPGKIGELLKAYLLKRSDGIPMARTAPVVIAERVTDLVALLLLCLVGVFGYAGSPALKVLLGLSALVVLTLTALLSSRRILSRLGGLLARLPLARRVAPKVDEFAETMADQLSPGPLAVTTALSCAAWLCECLGFWLIVRGLPGQGAPLDLAIFIYAATTVLGALSFVPGGLGVTEGSMTLLLRSASGLSRAGAAAATLLIRLCTLWFGVLTGLVALTIYQRRHKGPLNLEAAKASSEDSDDPHGERL